MTSYKKRVTFSEAIKQLLHCKVFIYNFQCFAGPFLLSSLKASKSSTFAIYIHIILQILYTTL